MNSELDDYEHSELFGLKFYVNSLAGYGLHADCMNSLTEVRKLAEVKNMRNKEGDACAALKSLLKNQRKPGFVTIAVLRMMKMDVLCNYCGASREAYDQSGDYAGADEADFSGNPLWDDDQGLM